MSKTSLIFPYPPDTFTPIRRSGAYARCVLNFVAIPTFGSVRSFTVGLGVLCACPMLVAANRLVSKLDAKSKGGCMSSILMLLGTTIMVALYFLPTIVAKRRGKTNLLAIFTLNLFLGFTLIGWVVALVWAVSQDNLPARTG